MNSDYQKAWDTGKRNEDEAARADSGGWLWSSSGPTRGKGNAGAAGGGTID